MSFYAIAMPQAEFDAWLAAEAKPALEPGDEAEQRGQAVFASSGCGACHTVRGAEAAGSGAPAGPAGPGVYRVVATLAPGQADRAELDKFRRGYSVSANVITRSGRIAELGWSYARERLDRK